MNTPTITGQAHPRSRGRPAADQGENLRESLLDAAESLFSNQGFAATPVRAVAEKAGVNPALVHYYFGNKRALLVAVLDRVLEPLAEMVKTLGEAEQTPPETLTTLLFSMLSEHPALLPLMVREALLPGGELHADFTTHYAPRLGGAFPALLAREQAEGRIRDDLAPEAMTLCILGLSLFPFIARSIAETVLGVTYDAAGQQKLLEQINSLLLSGVKA